MLFKNKWLYFVGGDDDTVFNPRINFSSREASFCQHIARVLAFARWLSADAERVIAHLERQRRQLGAFAVLEVGFIHTITLIQMRIVKKIGGLGQRRERNFQPFKYGG